MTSSIKGEDVAATAENAVFIAILKEAHRMRGLRMQESNGFIAFFKLVQAEAQKQDSVFFEGKV